MKLSCPAAAVLESLGFGFFPSPFVTIFPTALNHAEMETVKICTKREVHMCWHFETPPQEFLAVYYKNWPLCAENQGPWRARVLQTAMEKLHSWGDFALEPVLTGKG